MSGGRGARVSSAPAAASASRRAGVGATGGRAVTGYRPLSSPVGGRSSGRGERKGDSCPPGPGSVTAAPAEAGGETNAIPAVDGGATGGSAATVGESPLTLNA